MLKALGNIKESIETYTEPMDILISLIFTAVLLFFSFVGFSTLKMTRLNIPIGIGTQADVYTTYYGFPLPMIGILTPIGSQQDIAATWFEMMGNSNVQILWGGLLVNFITFFLLCFFVIYVYRRFIKD